MQSRIANTAAATPPASTIACLNTATSKARFASAPHPLRCASASAVCCLIAAAAGARAEEARAQHATCTAAAAGARAEEARAQHATCAAAAAGAQAEEARAQHATCAAAAWWQRMRRRALQRLAAAESRAAAGRVAALAAARLADLAPVIAALEWRFECEARSALARLADAFSGDTLHQPGLDGDASGPQDAWIGCAASRTVPRAGGCAAGRRPVPGRGRRRPHVRWRARRESIYIRCSPSTLLQQRGRGMLDVRMVTPRPGG